MSDVTGLAVLAIILGLAVGLVGGQFSARGLHCCLTTFIPDPPEGDKDDQDIIPVKWTGYTERAFFVLIVAGVPDSALAGLLPAIMLWIAAKVAANWKQRPPKDNRMIRGQAMRSVLGSLTSVGIAVVGGFIIRWGLIQLFGWW